ncbi:hypothetical protein JTE90_014752 [Oedothorax gibbosus]|uniref:Metalloendopeptidase n=1 Tax=Oedothorax gibbosus TaxID=931172 RepID=A0AAV6US96_9ARAC|nr:hypothetical protein JTE90_014752 [Oedothorax gibbosus]
MLWQLVVGLVAFLTPSGVEKQDEEPFVPYGPQNPRSLRLAHEALHGDKVNGDMLFTDDFPADAGIKDTRFRWPGYPGRGEIPYVIDPALNSMKPLILQAMDQYHKLTCLKFVPRTNQRDYIKLVSLNGCYSYVGRRGGEQPVSLGSGCGYIGTIVHELGHAIGLFHEHQRSDRNTYITVYGTNVQSGKGKNFDLTNPSAEIISTGYDYSSIMHYGTYAFSKQPGVLKTMEAKNGQPLLEPFQKPGFTNSDITMIKSLYKC